MTDSKSEGILKSQFEAGVAFQNPAAKMLERGKGGKKKMFNQTPNPVLGALSCKKQAAFSKMVFRGWKWWYASLSGCWMRPPLAPLSDCSQWLNLNNVWMWGCICTLYSFTRVEERICVPMHSNICEYGDTPCVVYVRRWIQCCFSSYLNFPTQTYQNNKITTFEIRV